MRRPRNSALHECDENQICIRRQNPSVSITNTGEVALISPSSREPAAPCLPLGTSAPSGGVPKKEQADSAGKKKGTKSHNNTGEHVPDTCGIPSLSAGQGLQRPWCRVSSRPWCGHSSPWCVCVCVCRASCADKLSHTWSHWILHWIPGNVQRPCWSSS